MSAMSYPAPHRPGYRLTAQFNTLGQEARRIMPALQAQDTEISAMFTDILSTTQRLIEAKQAEIARLAPIPEAAELTAVKLAELRDLQRIATRATRGIELEQQDKRHHTVLADLLSRIGLGGAK